MRLNLEILKMSPKLFTWHYIEGVADQTDHFTNAFVCENVVQGYDIKTALWHSKVYSQLHKFV